ncbi:uncharacterized protein SOCE26_001790 [Sorangium cellulosum]|uniref:Uncharacterized protein n=2 Tax=Sorangium cellulosum TaxID=56 RepID=A0A2L0EHP5_SORCE|nr:uncharacterized protein SOCE26_001790 [Sorangium cellulosum]
MTPDDSGAVSRNISAECPRPHLAELDQEHGLFIVCEGDQTVTPGKVLRLDPETLETRSEAVQRTSGDMRLNPHLHVVSVSTSDRRSGTRRNP